MNLSQEAIGHKGSNFYSKGSVAVFLRKPIATCAFQGRSRPLPPLDTSLLLNCYFKALANVTRRLQEFATVELNLLNVGPNFSPNYETL